MVNASPVLEQKPRDPSLDLAQIPKLPPERGSRQADHMAASPIVRLMFTTANIQYHSLSGDVSSHWMQILLEQKI